MIAFLRCALLVCLLSNSTIRAQSKPNIPSIQVRTDSQSAKVTGFGRSQSKHPKPAKVEVQTVNIRIDLRSFAPPQVPYDVQCFVVARSDLDGSKYICDVQRKPSAAQFDTIVFEGGPMTDIRKWISIPTNEMTTSGQPVNASPVISKRIKGTKYYGWVIRVVSNQTAVRYESNQPELKLAAEKTPAAFDMAVAGVSE